MRNKVELRLLVYNLFTMKKEEERKNYAHRHSSNVKKDQKWGVSVSIIFFKYKC